MSVPMKKHHIEVRVNNRKFLLKKEMTQALILYLQALNQASLAWLSPAELRKEFLDDLPRSSINLKAARSKFNLSQVALSKKTGIDRSNLIAYEKGRKRIGKKIAEKIAAVLKIDPRLISPI